MPSIQQICHIVAGILQGYTARQQAWKGIYKTLLWYEAGVPHIVETNSLKKKIWQIRAKQVELALSQAFHCPCSQVVNQVDQLMQHPSLKGKQRQNFLGIGLTCSIVFLLRNWVTGYTFLQEARVGPQGNVFRDIANPPRERIDVVALQGNAEYAIVSTKWSIRHDRLRDLLEECTIYKRHRPNLKFFVVTNEFMPSRLHQLIKNQCIDKVFHINRDLVKQVNSGDGRLNGLEDLPDLPSVFP